jgi:hypothetical protein
MTQTYSDDEFESDMRELHASGFPTFDEFRKNPDKWRAAATEVFESAQNSFVDPLARSRLSKQKYYWRYSKESFPLEKLEHICKEEGYTPDQVDILPMRQTGPTAKDEMIIRFFPRHELKAMGAVLPNA